LVEPPRQGREEEFGWFVLILEEGVTIKTDQALTGDERLYGLQIPGDRSHPIYPSRDLLVLQELNGFQHLALFNQLVGDVFMEDHTDQCLIGDPVVFSLFFKPLKVMLSDSQTDGPVLFGVRDNGLDAFPFVA